MGGKFNNQKGFTLVEIMMVVIIIGILAVLAIPRYQKYTLESKLSEVAVAVGEIKTGMEKYYNSHGNRYTDIPSSPGNDYLERILRIDLGQQKNFEFQISQSKPDWVSETGYFIYGKLTSDGQAEDYASSPSGAQVQFAFPKDLIQNWTTHPDWSKGWNDYSFFAE